MTDREVGEIVRDVERYGLDDLDRAREILYRGVTVDEYQSFERRRTWRWLAVCLIVTTAVCAACIWSVRS